MMIYTVYEIDDKNDLSTAVFKLFSTKKKDAKDFYDKHKSDFLQYGSQYNLIFAYYDGEDEEIDGNALSNFYPIETTL